MILHNFTVTLLFRMHILMTSFPYPLFSHFLIVNSLCDHTTYVALFPGPRPASRRLQYGTASDGKLGGGLGMRLLLMHTA